MKPQKKYDLSYILNNTYLSPILDEITREIETKESIALVRDLGAHRISKEDDLFHNYLLVDTNLVEYKQQETDLEYIFQFASLSEPETQNLVSLNSFLQQLKPISKTDGIVDILAFDPVHQIALFQPANESGQIDFEKLFVQQLYKHELDQDYTATTNEWLDMFSMQELVLHCIKNTTLFQDYEIMNNMQEYLSYIDSQLQLCLTSNETANSIMTQLGDTLDEMELTTDPTTFKFKFEKEYKQVFTKPDELKDYIDYYNLDHKQDPIKKENGIYKPTPEQERELVVQSIELVYDQLQNKPQFETETQEDEAIEKLTQTTTHLVAMLQQFQLDYQILPHNSEDLFSKEYISQKDIEQAKKEANQISSNEPTKN